MMKKRVQEVRQKEHRRKILTLIPWNLPNKQSLEQGLVKSSQSAVCEGIIAQFELPSPDASFVVWTSNNVGELRRSHRFSLPDIVQLDALVVLTTASGVDEGSGELKGWSFDTKTFAESFLEIQKQEELSMLDESEGYSILVTALLQGDVPVIWVVLVPFISYSKDYPFPLNKKDRLSPVLLETLWKKKTRDLNFPNELKDQVVYVIVAEVTRNIDRVEIETPYIYYDTLNRPNTRLKRKEERKLAVSNFHAFQEMHYCTRYAEDIVKTNLLEVIPNHSLVALIHSYSNPCVSANRQVAHLFAPKTSTSALISCQSDLWIAQRLSELVQTIQKQKGKKDASAIVGPFSYSYCAKHKRHSLHIPLHLSKIAQKAIQKAANQLVSSSKKEVFLLEYL
jgi:hypothetical protein